MVFQHGGTQGLNSQILTDIKYPLKLKIGKGTFYPLRVNKVFASTNLGMMDMSGNKECQIGPNLENRVGDKPCSKPQSRIAAIKTKDLCVGALSL